MATESEIQQAKAKMDSAYNAIAPAKASMQSYYNWLSRCKYKDGVLELGVSADIKCQTKLNCNNDCCSSKTCEEIVASYNAQVFNWETVTNNYESAQEYYDTVRGEKTDEKIEKIQNDSKLIRTQWYVGGAILVILIIVGVYFWMKYNNK